MITLTQTEHKLLGSVKDIAALAAEQKTRILVISDSHGQRDMFRRIVEQTGPSCGALVFCGDGATDFASCMNYAAENKLFAACVPSVAGVVQGNGDPDRISVRFDTGVKTTAAGMHELYIPRRQILSAAGHTVYIVHGHEQGAYYGTGTLEEEGKTAGADVVLYGHTHIADETRSGICLINPGSIAHPREGTPPSFAVVEIGGADVTTIFYRIESGPQGVRFVPFIPKLARLWK